MPIATNLKRAKRLTKERAETTRGPTTPLETRLLGYSGEPNLLVSGARSGKTAALANWMNADRARTVALGHVPYAYTIEQIEELDHTRKGPYKIIQVATKDGRILAPLDLETGDGEWIDPFVHDEELTESELEYRRVRQRLAVVGYAARRWWLRQTAESMLRRDTRGECGVVDCEALDPFWQGRPWTISMVNERLQEMIAALEPGAIFLLVDSDEHWPITERRVTHFIGEPPLDTWQLGELLLPMWRVRSARIMLAPRERLANIDRWTSDVPTMVWTTPVCDDWTRFPFSCEEKPVLSKEKNDE